MYPLKRTLAALFVAAVCLNGGGVFAQTSNTLAALQAQLEARLDQPQFAEAQWGVKVVSLESGKTVFEHNAEKLMKPASNAKMYTASLALNRLGPTYRIKTSFYAHAKPDETGTIHGDLLVYGRGDPSFSSRFNDDNYSKALQPVLEALAAAGIKHIEGDLVGDDSYFRGPSMGSDWTWDDLQNYYGAPASALTYQDNVVDLIFKPGNSPGAPVKIITMPDTDILAFNNRTRTTAAGTRARIRMYEPLGESTPYVWGQVPLGNQGVEDSIAVPDPARWFVTQLKKELIQRGITVSGKIRTKNWLDEEAELTDLSQWVEVAAVESRSLAEIVKETLKPSENLYAQLLLLQVGVTSPAKEIRANENTEDAGLAEMRKFLTQAGIKRGTVFLQEGSGLSRSALVTPEASVQLLTYMSHNRYRDAFTNALPIAGVDGTLRNRFKGTRAAGNVHAKTGSLGFVNTLSGYLTTAGHENLVFSIMLNNYAEGEGHANGRAEIDALVELLVNYSGADL